jgi:hypothetical protein
LRIAFDFHSSHRSDRCEDVPEVRAVATVRFEPQAQVAVIGASAFEECSARVSIWFPASVAQIGPLQGLAVDHFRIRVEASIL